MKKIKEIIKHKLGEKKTDGLKKALKVARIVKNTVCWILIAVLTLAVITFMLTKMSGGTPSFFGYSMHRIISGSMEPELSVGDVILNKKVSEPSEVSVGDIITFQGGFNFDNQIVTHRVLVSPYDNGMGDIVLVTKGDANEKDDGDISFSNVESKFVSKVSFLKDIYSFFFSKWGLIVFIFLLLLIFFDEIVNIVRVSVSSSEQENTESIKEIIERVQREQNAAQNSDKALEEPGGKQTQTEPDGESKQDTDRSDTDSNKKSIGKKSDSKKSDSKKSVRKKSADNADRKKNTADRKSTPKTADKKGNKKKQQSKKRKKSSNKRKK